MKEIANKIILSIFYILCITAFFLLVIELPYILNEIFNTTLFNHAKTIIFIICVIILGYTLNYYSIKDSDEDAKRKILELHKLQSVKNIYSLNYDNLKIIQKIEFSEIGTAHIWLLNNYNFHIPLEDFVYINNQKSLNVLDCFISNLRFEEAELSIPFKYEKFTTDYLRKLKKN